LKNNKIIFLSYFSIGLIIIDGPIFTLKALVWSIIAQSYPYFVALGLMFVSILFLRYFLLFIYDFIGIDCFKIELKKAGNKYDENHITRKIDRIKKTTGKIVIMALLTVTLDPTIAVIYCSPGSFNCHKFKTLETIIVFFIGNLWTVILWGNLIEIIF